MKSFKQTSAAVILGASLALGLALGHASPLPARGLKAPPLTITAPASDDPAPSRGLKAPPLT